MAACTNSTDTKLARSKRVPLKLVGASSMVASAPVASSSDIASVPMASRTMTNAISVTFWSAVAFPSSDSCVRVLFAGVNAVSMCRPSPVAGATAGRVPNRYTSGSVRDENGCHAEPAMVNRVDDAKPLVGATTT